VILRKLVLFEYRSYSKAEFLFSDRATVIIGPNSSGKSNLIEALYLLSNGKSFRTEKDYELIMFSKNLTRVKGTFEESNSSLELELVIAKNGNKEGVLKKFLVNGVPKRRIDFSRHLNVVLFSPEDVDIVNGSPSKRRYFLDEVLSQVDINYQAASLLYIKALRQRNALLENARHSSNLGKQFEYWDNLLITNGNLITQKREEFIQFLNTSRKNIFSFNAIYDKSIISKERLKEYEQAQINSGVTLVGPHRDELIFEMFNDQTQSIQNVRTYGSRGQERLLVLELKLLQLAYMQEILKTTPLLLLDDIFSELDKRNIGKILELINIHQTVITTTHKEFIPDNLAQNTIVIELNK